MDTGCGRDLITPDVADGCKKPPVERVTFHAAGRRVKTKPALTINSAILQGGVQPHALPSTPWVLSVGKQAMGIGYSVAWVAKNNPYLVSPTGVSVDLHAHRDIPYFRRSERFFELTSGRPRSL